MKNKPALYPLKFEPILKEKVWGGEKLINFLNKGNGTRIGESWEISGVEDNISKVANGSLQHKSLQWLMENYQEELLGKRSFETYGNVFPLLFKFIDAREDLSVQVHPNDKLAKIRHKSFGKTEMWYILDHEPDAELIIGFNKEIDREEYVNAVINKKLVELLSRKKVQNGDAFVIKPGMVHAIGGGVLLAEIQQTSDITYRIYDWDRPDSDGKMRELHIDMALEAINFSHGSPRLDYNQQMNIPVHIGKTSYFEVNKLSLSREFNRNLNFSDSFKVYMCVSGDAILESNGFSEKVRIGETILVPATLSKMKFKTSGASFLEVFIP